MTTRSLDLEHIRQLVQLFENSSAAVLDLQWGTDRLRLESGNRSPSVTPTVQDQPVAPAGAPQPAPEAKTDVGQPGHHTIRSSIVGTFYRAPDPDAPPFVEIGDRVQVGQVICIVEAMKLMNEIEADASGVVVEISAENGHAVGYDEPLFVLAPLSGESARD